jgi:phytoene/squalene synthetase
MKEDYFELVQKIDLKQIQKNPILDISARFWEKERYKAAKILYKPMRVIDDLIDNKKSTGNINETDKKKFMSAINCLIESINKGTAKDSTQKKLIETIAKFKIPVWPWQKFCKAMIYDVHYNGFKDLKTFLKYAEGAAVAPASIGLHLCGAIKKTAYITLQSST